MQNTNSPESPLTKVVVKDLKYTEAKQTGVFKYDHKFYIKLTIDDQVRRTAVSARTKTPVWNDIFYFYAHNTSKLTLKVYIDHTGWRDECVGWMDETLTALLSEQMVHRKLEKHPGSKKPQSSIELHITSTSADPTAPEVHQAQEDVEKLSLVLFPDLVGKADTFLKLVAGIFEVEPHAKAAWSILSTTIKVVVDQQDRDEKINKLVQSLDNFLAFLLEAKALKNIQTSEISTLTKQQTKNLQLIAMQVTECAYFISEYSKDKNIGARITKNIFSDIDNKIKGFEDKFKELKLGFQEHSAIVTQITVLQTKFLAQQGLAGVNHIASNIDLNETLLYAEGASCVPERGCLPGTRQGIIDEIVAWANMPTSEASPRLLWLNGVAGSGKSAIAHSVAHHFQVLNRLGSSFCFDATNQASRKPHHLFSTISRDLAIFDPSWRDLLWNVIKGKPSLRRTYSEQYQFDSFLVQPAQSLAVVGPIVIVIDALDECGDSSSRKRILSILETQLSQLPANFRIILTSRPELDISEALQNRSQVTCKTMNNIAMLSNKQDISLFIQAELAGKPEMSLGKYQPNWCDALVEKAEGLFQWAFTACLFIKQQGYLPHEQFQELLKTSGGYQLDNLYSKVLEQAFSNHGLKMVARFRLVIGGVLAVNTPLSMDVLRKLYFGQDPEVISTILGPLGAVFSGVTSESVPIHPLHTSFRDFLTDRDRAGVFHVPMLEAQNNLTLACFDVMEKGLHFNMCQLPTSYQWNRNIPDLTQRIQRSVSSHLSYACTYWADHLKDTEFNNTIKTYLVSFMASKLLYWLEVLSVKQIVNIADGSLEKAAIWIEFHDPDTEALTRDAQRFVANFWDVITQSVPHIYLSALPFSPEHSIVAKHYTGKFANTLHLKTAKPIYWQGIKHTMEGHTEKVWCIAFSPDGKWIASGSEDCTIQVWNVETGNPVGEPLKGHTSSVLAVAFSPDSKHLASGSADNTSRVWDVETRTSVGEPFIGHTDIIWAIAFSPDGKCIASSSADHTIRVWNAGTDTVVVALLLGHTDEVNSVTFSPDGKHIASGSDDRTIRIWDAETGISVGDPFEGHENYIYSVAFSPDGKQIASGSGDRTVRVWNAETGASVGNPLQGHTSQVASVAFSPDGKHIVSGSHDKSIRVWDVKTGNPVGKSFEGHTSDVTSVAFSPDGKCIASSSQDTTVRVWDRETGIAIDHPLEQHNGTISCVTFSPDGKYIVSSSYDKTIRVWDSETGMSIGTPLQDAREVNSLALSPDGKYIASGSDGGTINLWNTETRILVREPFTEHTSDVYTVMFSPDGKYIASGSHDETIRIWNTESGNLVSKPFKGHTDTVWSVRFSPNGQYIASGSADNTVRIWNTETGTLVGNPFMGHTDAVRSVAFSPNGKCIASGSKDKTIRVWDAETGTPIGNPLKGHTDLVLSVAFSPDGKQIASGSRDATVRVWDVETRTAIGRPLQGHTHSVASVAFSPSGTQIVSGSEDTTIKLWNTPRVSFANELSVSFPNPTGTLPTVENIRYESNAAGLTSLANSKQSLNVISAPFILEQRFSLHKQWALGPNKELLFWIPPFLSPGLHLFPNTHILGGDSTEIDYSCFVHGTSWVNCKTSPEF